MKIIKYLYIPFLFVAIACGEDGHSHSESEHGSETEVTFTERQKQLAGITIGDFTTGEISEIVSANGMIDVPPQYKASVSVPLGGFVKSTKILIGDHVHKGELLAVLYHPEYIKFQQNYLEEYNRHIMLVKELERQKELGRYDINARKALEQAESEEKISYARLKALEAHLSLLGVSAKEVLNGKISSTIYLKSPISGDVAQVNAQVGKFATPQDVLFEIINKDHLHIELSVYEKDVLKIKKGQKIKFVKGDSDREYSAEIILIGQSLDPETRSVRVHAHPEEDDNINFLHGMYVKAKIFTSVREVLMLPESAIITEDNQNYIFISSGNGGESTTFKKIPVSTGQSERGFVEIKHKPETSDRDKIVLVGAYYLAAHMRRGEGHEH